MKNVIKVVCIGLLVLASNLFAVSFGSSSNDKPKYINIEGKEFKFVIGTASKTGKYYAAGSRLCTGINDCIVADTDGSKQNMELLADGLINGAIVQADAFNTFLENNPQYKDILLASSLDAEEEIQIVMMQGQDEDNLQNKKAVIYVGQLKSGGAASWTAMTKLESGYAKAAVVSDTYDATSAIAINKLKSGEFTALIRTSMANPDDKFVKKVQEDKEIQFVDINDRNLNDSIKINGKDQPMYQFKDMVLSKGFFSNTKVEVPSVKILFVFNKNLYSTQQLNEMLDNISVKKSGLFR